MHCKGHDMKTKIYTKLVFFLFICFFSLTTLSAKGLTFGLAVEPEENGQTLLANVGWEWNDKIASTARLSYLNTTERLFSLPGFGTAFQSTQTQNLQAEIAPFVRIFKPGPFTFTCSTGVDVLRIIEERNAIVKDTDGQLTTAGQYFTYANERTATIISPRIGIAAAVRVLGFLDFFYDGRVSPLYHLSLDQEIEYDFLSGPDTNSVQRWSSPLVSQKFTVTAFNSIRGVFSHSLQRLNFQTMDWHKTEDKLTGYDDIQNIQKTRVGAELLIPLSGGSMKLKCGFYMDFFKTTSSYWDTLNNTHSFAFAFGTER